MEVVIYAEKSEYSELTGVIAALPECCYRNVEITGCSDYDGFVEKLRAGPPQLILIAMNGAEGMEGVIAAKSLAENAPIIWLSDDKGFGAQSYRLGCAYFHEKPVPSEALSTAIAKCV